MQVEHIGIAVKDLEAGNALYARLLGQPHYKIETVDSEYVNTSFFRAGATKIELLEATHPDSTIARFIEKRGEGIHHIALQVDDLDASLDELKQMNVQLIDQRPRIGAEDKRIAFIHPKATGGILVELSESKK